MKHILIIVAALVIVLVGVLLFTADRSHVVTDVPNVLVPIDDNGSTEEINRTAYGYSYEYTKGDSDYTVVIDDQSPRGHRVFSESVFSTSEYIDLVSSTEPREGPPGFTIEVYKNPMNVSAEEWIRTETASNFSMSTDGSISQVKKGGTDFVMYQYDGLYRVTAYAYGNNGYLYLISNMWSDPTASSTTDMDELINTMEFTDPAYPAQAAHGDIKISTPQPNTIITSPLAITGVARGFWFFEASFPVTLTDWNGLIIAEGIATADGEWMTEDYVPFTAELTFTKPNYGERGSLILQKDNPSGLPENDDAIEIPVLFE